MTDILIPPQEGTSGKTALHLAVETQERGLVQFLLQAGAQVDARMLNGCTPLHLAAGRGLMGISSTLCKAGADSLLRNVEDETPQDLTEEVRGICFALQGLTHPQQREDLSLAERAREPGVLGYNQDSITDQLWELEPVSLVGQDQGAKFGLLQGACS